MVSLRRRSLTMARRKSATDEIHIVVRHIDDGVLFRMSAGRARVMHLQKHLWNRRARLMSMLRRTPKSRHVIRRSACLSQHFDLTKTRPRTTRHDRWARLVGMGDILQHESLIATLQSSWSKSCKHLLSSTLPEQPDSCPLRGQTNQDRLLQTSHESVPVYLFPERRDRDLLSTRSRRSGKCRLDAMGTDSALGNRIEV
jgi:hypothetical protein